MSFVNEAAWDRIARMVVGIVLLYLGWAGMITGGWGAFLKVIAFVPLAKVASSPWPRPTAPAGRGLVDRGPTLPE